VDAKAENSFQEEGNPHDHGHLQDMADLDIHPLNDVHRRVAVLQSHRDQQEDHSRCQGGDHILAANNRGDIPVQEVAVDDSLDDLTKSMDPQYMVNQYEIVGMTVERL